MPKPLTVVAHLQAVPGKEGALRQALLELVEHTRKEEGCVQYDLHEENDKPGHFLFYENWTSKDALDRHMASPHFSAFLPRVPELSSAPPQILMYTRLT
jgi:quinol monooxygenase YgiN